MFYAVANLELCLLRGTDAWTDDMSLVVKYTEFTEAVVIANGLNAVVVKVETIQ